MGHKKVKLLALTLFCTGLTGLKAQTVKDIDGNVYNTVKIGTQTWLKENLKVTKYNNGDVIKTTTPANLDVSQEESKAKYQWAYDGDESKVAVYGRLYTWYAITDKRNVCPTGWHVPTDAEWVTLIDYLGGEDVAGEKLKEKGQIHWRSPMGATNESGFTALPGGYRDASGKFGGLRDEGYWRCSTEYNTYFAWYLSMLSAYRNTGKDYNVSKENGLSVRCLKD
jgi:uncharacterized protein (TIGR02145 family)